MAKKNSTKTAAKEALQNSEPRIQTFQKWSGINIKEAPLGWEPLESGNEDFNETDLAPNFLAVQNNVNLTSFQALEVRNELMHIAKAPSNEVLTGVMYMRDDYIFVACESGNIYRGQVSDTELIGTTANAWEKVIVVDGDGESLSTMTWSCINSYQNELIALGKNSSGNGEIFSGSLDSLFSSGISSAKYIDNPSSAPTLTKKGSLEDGDVCLVKVCYVYCNKYGYTLASPIASNSYDSSPVSWSANRYLQIKGSVPTDKDITGVDIYASTNENQSMIFIGHVDIVNEDNFTYNWLGSMMDTSQWTNVPLDMPTENSTKGVDAEFVNLHDGRLYFWGGSQEYRLWIGGNPGHELSVARGVGGAYVDIEPGSGTVIHHTHKFKTYQGANIVTIMCGNENTGKVKRFNLLETNVSITNEYSMSGYMTEEVSNVVGCDSDYGSGVWADGLYSISRYGLTLTTQAMESNNQLRSQLVSDAIQPIFTDRISELLHNSRMICSDDIIYICLAKVDDNIAGEAHTLDNVILCYDINQKAWYTYTIDNSDFSVGVLESGDILHIYNHDSAKHWEGVGIVTANNIWLLPNTDNNYGKSRNVTFSIETGELAGRIPITSTLYLCQLEFRFDYIVGNLKFLVEGIDYYGRYITVEKEINIADLERRYIEWIRIDHLLESYRITITGNAHFRMTHINAKAYTNSNKINLVYGFDAKSSYINPGQELPVIHHDLSSYNDLRNAIVT